MVLLYMFLLDYSQYKEIIFLRGFVGFCIFNIKFIHSSEAMDAAGLTSYQTNFPQTRANEIYMFPHHISTNISMLVNPRDLFSNPLYL
jgi:hypothetical protein